ncbi:S-DNA-T family DNA segregation ATPase FtsK/SpoIIIE [Caulobacter rhizosphaerae]|jgi:S-DNA-T family DNA segregation ATPase FtsK/SpoIIIE|uniref:DNA translocase FtsK n=1 Tax=Caulobacter rhizosphaerae TaxID=2010972 RepID=A0ABU1N679_9CAUL|nr:DNA translocase FtsK 4TM domain-containing protein [Caulobacter rhizosphaerae]MDR6533924.1 S-DNA-T family DNA segregation ATPase FtsK/SpoIIIE [Caulobacter rhizosphaerae]
MARAARRSSVELVWDAVRYGWAQPWSARFRGGVICVVGAGLLLSVATYNAADPSLNAATGLPATNALGGAGAALADVVMQSMGLAGWMAAALMLVFGLSRVTQPDPAAHRRDLRIRALVGGLGLLALAGLLAAPPRPAAWPLAKGLGGFWGDGVLNLLAGLLAFARLPGAHLIAALLLAIGAAVALGYAIGVRRIDPEAVGDLVHGLMQSRQRAPEPAPVARPEPAARPKAPRKAAAPVIEIEPEAAPRKAAAKPAKAPPPPVDDDDAFEPSFEVRPLAIAQPKVPAKSNPREQREQQKAFDFEDEGGFQLPELAMLAKPKPRSAEFDEEALRQNARLLESVLAEFGVRGQIDQIRPGPVVTMYELVPAAGTKTARVVALADDIARSMSVISCRVAVAQGRNAIGIEMPNSRRETVYLRDLLSSSDYDKASHILPMALGETIGGDTYIADLAKMPHLLIAGTTGSGKSVGVNAMILSILYKLPPEKCRFIMIDPKMLELSVYDGIPHLLAPVVTDPKKAVVALKWTVREMEDRYRRMSKIGVRNIGGFNEKAVEALEKGEHFERTVQTGFDDAGRPIYETEKIRPEPMPYLVVVIDEVADLMMVAGKDIEGAVQRLAQMARAAGIHLIMATQRPSVDVITGTIKANFPTRISFQVTSKIDARTILGEQGAEQLLGQGDMLYMAGGGRITRLHGPFVSDGEVEAVAKFLRDQGIPNYLEEVTAGGDEEQEEAIEGAFAGEGGANDLYDHAVAVVTRDRKASTSYIQRRLQIGYNRAASLMERMEKEGVVGAANHAGKREILAPPPPPM